MQQLSFSKVTYHYSYELKPHLDLLFHVIIISDSWQTKRLMLAFNGIPNDKDGLFDIISRSQNHYQKRAYQIIKMLVQLFTK
jgi:ubiquitin carboxyl-terminal hydrolase 9/24